jgi:hypothetical protein
MVLGQLVHLAPSGYTGSLTLTDRTEVRTRTGYAGSGIGFDADNAIGTNLNFDGKRTTFGLSYGARFSYFDVGGSNSSLDIMQFGRLGVSWFDRKLRLNMGLEGSIGNQNSAALALPVTLSDSMGTPGQPTVPTAPTVTYVLPPGRLYTGYARASLGATYSFSRLWQTSASVFGAMGGGFDWQSQQANPPNRSVGTGVSVGYNLSRTDILSTTANGSYTYVLDTPLPPGGAPFKYGGKYLNLGMFESYSHTFNARTIGAAGLGFSHVRDASRSDNGNFFGAGLLGLSYGNTWNGGMVTTSGSLSVGTTYNPIVATVQQTASASFGLSYTMRKWSVGANLGTATSIPLNTPGTSRTLSGGASLSYLANDVVQVQGGVRMSAQILPATAGSDLPPSYGGFVALLLTAPPIHL